MKKNYRNFVGLDVVPFIYDVSYYHQLRVGLEGQRLLREKFFIAVNLDFGIYNDYTFIKYFDFFNQNSGFYSIEQNVYIKGFHFIPSYNYFIFQSKRKSNTGVFGGILMDFHFYRKDLEQYNSLTKEIYHANYDQKTISFGLALGFKYNIFYRFYAEIRTSLMLETINHLSNNEMEKIQSLNSQWVDKKRNFSWVSFITLDYAF